MKAYLVEYRNGWGASAVDALSTAIIMEFEDIVDTILDHVATIDWRRTSTSVSVFETTIRYMGGLLSGECDEIDMKEALANVKIRIRSAHRALRSPLQ
jgi:hypothetical protein